MKKGVDLFVKLLFYSAHDERELSNIFPVKLTLIDNKDILIAVNGGGGVHLEWFEGQDKKLSFLIDLF